MSRRSRKRTDEEAEEHVNSPEEEDEDEDEDVDEDEDEDEDFELSLQDLLGGLSLDSFLHEFWGKKVLSTTIEPSLLGKIARGLCDGDLEQIARKCRKDDNSKFSGQEIEDMESQLEENRRTVNLPFCFAKSAVALKQAFIATPGAPASDIEVGVYISRGGGDPAAWHFDNNHNITIQVYGSKDWLYTPGPPLAMASRALTDLPHDAVSQSRPIPSTSRSSPDVRCISLRPGSVLYVPPGHWHSVIPANGARSLAMDLRVATIPRAKWISEALFAVMALGIRGDSLAGDQGMQLGNGEWGAAVGWGPGSASTLPVVLGEDDWAASRGGRESADEDENCALVSSVVGSALRWCKPPRALPFESDLSDGMLLSGRLAFLIDTVGARWSRVELEPRSRVRVNPMVTVGVKERDGTETVLCLRSLSSLTSSEYLRYDLVCSALMLPVARVLSTQRCTTVGQLLALADTDADVPADRAAGKKRKKAGGAAPEFGRGIEELGELLHALAYANVVVVGRAAAGASSGAASPAQAEAAGAGSSSSVIGRGPGVPGGARLILSKKKVKQRASKSNRIRDKL